MKHLLLSCDFLGFAPSLHFENKKVSQSMMTGVLSLLVIIISLIASGYFVYQYSNPKPVVIKTFEAQEDFGPYEVSNLGFNPMLGLTDQSGNYYTNTSFFTVKAYQDSFKSVISNGASKDVYTTTELEVGICSKYYSQDDISEKNIKISLNSVYCVKPGQAKIQGFWGRVEGYSLLRITFQKCVNTTQNNFSCISPEEIDNRVQGGYLSIDYSNFIVDEKNYTTPLQKIIFDDFNVLNSGSSLKYNVMLNPINFVSDNGFVFENNYRFKGFSQSSKIISQTAENNDIVGFTFQGASSSDIYLRSYPKIQTVLTQIGGFIKFTMVFGNLISLIYSRNCFLTQFLLTMTNLGNYRTNRHSNEIFTHNRANFLINDRRNLDNTTNLTLIGLTTNNRRANNELINTISLRNGRQPKSKGWCLSIYNQIIKVLTNCKKNSFRNRLITRVNYIYLKSTSVETVIKKSYDVELMKSRILGSSDQYDREFKLALTKTIVNTRTNYGREYEIFDLNN